MKGRMAFVDDGSPFWDWWREASAAGGGFTEDQLGPCLLAFEAGRRAPAPRARRKVSWWRYAIHNLVGHPLMFVLGVVGLRRASVWVHENTLPRAVRGMPLQLAIEAGELLGPRDKA